MMDFILSESLNFSLCSDSLFSNLDTPGDSTKDANDQFVLLSYILSASFAIFFISSVYLLASEY